MEITFGLNDLEGLDKIIEKLETNKEFSMNYFKILMDLDKNIWIIGREKIIRFDRKYFHEFL